MNRNRIGKVINYPLYVIDLQLLCRLVGFFRIQVLFVIAICFIFRMKSHFMSTQTYKYVSNIHKRYVTFRFYMQATHLGFTCRQIFKQFLLDQFRIYYIILVYQRSWCPQERKRAKKQLFYRSCFHPWNTFNCCCCFSQDFFMRKMSERYNQMNVLTSRENFFVFGTQPNVDKNKNLSISIAQFGDEEKIFQCFVAEIFSYLVKYGIIYRDFSPFFMGPDL
eukprot:TRINITY_DN1033_c0_g1_i6.p1 TRINITY_DN1033_c0_g1~~TRINITY_DN1033_c0_g1_i6.p1  ORF type:complete len:221 (+),score=-7.56 TRINITY_DN1033_c0_g1_i6:366-1028(+)